MKAAIFSAALIEFSIHEVMQIAGRIGVDGIEIAGREPHFPPSISVQRVREIKRLAEEFGLAIPAIAGYSGRFAVVGDQESGKEFDDIRRMLAMAAELGVSMLRVQHGGPNAFQAQPYHYERAAHWIRMCADEADQYHIRIVMEIHNQSILEQPPDCMRLHRLIGRGNVGFIHDAANMYITDTDYGPQSVGELGELLFHVHVKDEQRIAEAGAPGTFRNLTRHGEEAFRHCRLGQGGVDHGPLFAALKQRKYSGWVAMECFAPFPPIENMEHDFRELKKLMQ